MPSSNNAEFSHSDNSMFGIYDGIVDMSRFMGAEQSGILRRGICLSDGEQYHRAEVQPYNTLVIESMKIYRKEQTLVSVRSCPKLLGRCAMCPKNQ